MKKITLLFFLLIGITSFSQQLYIEGGKTISSFDYKNSQGEKLSNLQATSQSFMSLGFRTQIFTKKLFTSIGTSYAGYGAIGSDNVLGNYMEWDVNYLEFNVGLDYELFKISNFIMYFKGNASVEFFLQGTQTINNTVINLKKQDDFDKTVFDFRGGFGLSHPISDNLSFYAQFMYGRSLKLKDGTANTNDQEELRFISKNVSLGLLIKLPNKKSSN